VPELDPVADMDIDTFPQHLFTVGQVELSRIDGPDEFETLAVIRL